MERQQQQQSQPDGSMEEMERVAAPKRRRRAHACTLSRLRDGLAVDDEAELIDLVRPLVKRVARGHHHHRHHPSASSAHIPASAPSLPSFDPTAALSWEDAFSLCVSQRVACSAMENILVQAAPSEQDACASSSSVGSASTDQVDLRPAIFAPSARETLRLFADHHRARLYEQLLDERQRQPQPQPRSQPEPQQQARSSSQSSSSENKRMTALNEAIAFACAPDQPATVVRSGSMAPLRAALFDYVRQVLRVASAASCARRDRQFHFDAPSGAGSGAGRGARPRMQHMEVSTVDVEWALAMLSALESGR